MVAQPRVTIITPSYNQAVFLEQTICSVLDQDYPDLEYFVVDGGSTDGSQAIIEKYAHRINWWVSEKDMGQAEAINKGFARATGKYIAWLNSDDVYQPGTIRAVVRTFREHPEAGLVYGNVLSIDAEGIPFNLMTYDDWSLKDLMCFNIIGQPAVFMRRSVLQKAGFLDLSYRFLLDHHIWLRMAQFGEMVYVPETWAAARIHAGAKNVALARGFGQEAYQLAAWMPYQPGLAALYKKHRRKIWAGANRMNGRYLLDGGEPWKALRAYFRSFMQYAPIALTEWRRIGYAFISLFVNVEKLKQRYLDRRKKNLFENENTIEDNKAADPDESR
ncbi:MAG: glycosyltransferase [Leptolinea sp.]|jgi:glycosyltransferase involved in cell wall biosynthesis|nr:glycosyltransferase [Leptolinea sp.]